MVRFAADGFAGTTIESVAAGAGIPADLVRASFGSTDGLRRACDARVREVFDDAEAATRVHGPAMGVCLVMARTDEAMAMAAYLGRLSAEGIPGPTGLFARLVAMTAESLEEMVACGSVHPSSDPQARAALLFCLRAGALLLADAVEDPAGTDVRRGSGLLRTARILMGTLRRAAPSVAPAHG